MTSVFTLSFSTVAVVASLAMPPYAFAGPLEDGVKAYSRADYTAASRLLVPLAEKGNSDAQYTVGLLYQNGQGVTLDKVKAHMWFDIASRSGDKDAAADRDALESNMTPQEIADAKKAAADWKPK